jgi:hypothetical protein
MTKIARFETTLLIELFLAVGLLISYPFLSQDSQKNNEAVTDAARFDDTAKFISGIPSSSGSL